LSIYEMLLAAWLLSRLAPRPAWCLALSTYAVFLVLALRQLLQGKASCGCFGSFEASPAVMAPLDAVVLCGLALDLKRLQGGVASRRALALGGAAFVAFLAVTLVAKERRAQGDPFIGAAGSIAVLSPGEWVGHDFPLQDAISINADLRQGRWRTILM